MHWLSYSAPLLEGAWVTVQLTFYSTILGAVVAFAAGIGKLSRNWLIKGLSVTFIEVFRGTSLLVQLFWLYFALPVFGQLIGIDLRLPAVVAGTLALGLNIGAYGAEVVRGAIQEVNVSQYEAAIEIVFTPHQNIWRFVLTHTIQVTVASFVS